MTTSRRILCAALLFSGVSFFAFISFTSAEAKQKNAHATVLASADYVIAGPRARVQNATVTSVDGQTITAVTGEGSTTVTWVANFIDPKSTKVAKTKLASAAFVVGDTVEIMGQIASSTDTPASFSLSRAQISKITAPKNNSKIKKSAVIKNIRTPGDLPRSLSSSTRPL